MRYCAGLRHGPKAAANSSKLRGMRNLPALARRAFASSAASREPYFQACIHPVRKRQALPGQHATPDRPAGNPLWPAMIAGVRRGNAAAAAWVIRMQRSLGLPGTIPVTCDAVKVVEMADSPITSEDLAAMAGA